MTFRIEAIHAAIAMDENGEEGVCAVLLGGTWMPLLSADEKRLPFIKEMGAAIGARDGKTVRLIRLDTRTDVETLFERAQ